MLSYLSDLTSLSDGLSWLRIFRYATFRAFAAAATSFTLSLLFGRRLIDRLRALRIGQQVRRGDEFAAIGHGKKQGTPTMGGLLMILSATAAALLWCRLDDTVLISLATLLYMGAVGFLDDLLKLRRGNSDGLSERNKYLLESLWAVAAFLWMFADPDIRAHLFEFWVPFRSTPLWTDVPAWVVLPWLALVIVGCTNAVNLTDGLDGLATGCYVSVNAAYLVLAYVAGHSLFARYLLVPAIPGAGELAVFLGGLLGAGLGFLWWNAYPAKVFMGDTGALALGGVISVVAVLLKQELLLAVAGIVFVAETASVIIQRNACKLYRWRTGQTLPAERRPFRMTPIHHHFEIVSKEHMAKLGRSPDAAENSVVVRFWVVSLVASLIALATLKVR